MGVRGQHAGVRGGGRSRQSEGCATGCATRHTGEERGEAPQDAAGWCRQTDRAAGTVRGPRGRDPVAAVPCSGRRLRTCRGDHARRRAETWYAGAGHGDRSLAAVRRWTALRGSGRGGPAAARTRTPRPSTSRAGRRTGRSRRTAAVLRGLGRCHRVRSWRAPSRAACPGAARASAMTPGDAARRPAMASCLAECAGVFFRARIALEQGCRRLPAGVNLDLGSPWNRSVPRRVG